VIISLFKKEAVSLLSAGTIKDFPNFCQSGFHITMVDPFSPAHPRRKFDDVKKAGFGERISFFSQKNKELA